MKIYIKIIKQMLLCLSLILWLAGCEKQITDFGFDGAISGKVVDESGNSLSGDITSDQLVVRALGEGDRVTINIRVKGDGTYQNTKMDTKKFKLWVDGAASMVNDTLNIDFSDNNIIEHDFVVVPFFTIASPEVVGEVTSTITVSYEIRGNNGHVSNRRRVYCSTNPYPNDNTGSGVNHHTVIKSLETDTGEINVTGLESDTKYYIRIGVRDSETQLFNYSQQIIVTTQ